MLTTDTRLRGLSILLATRAAGMAIVDLGRAMDRSRWWVQRRISGRQNPTATELDEIASVVGCSKEYLRYHHRMPLQSTVVAQ